MVFLFFVVFICTINTIFSQGDTLRGAFQRGCDLEAAKQCEFDLIQCRLFSGPADDAPTMCRCGEKFYGECLRLAGCEYHEEYGPGGQNYGDKCVNHIMQYDCPAPGSLMCAVNCATSGTVDASNTRKMLFNNYGEYYLRIRICSNTVHQRRLNQYSVVDTVPCDDTNDAVEDDFQLCARWVPPFTYTPVALPPETTYIEVDRCVVTSDGEQYCLENETPTRIYGNERLFPTSYDYPKSDVSVCASDADCRGSRCELNFKPSTCSPKLKRHYQQSGANYKAVD